MFPRAGSVAPPDVGKEHRGVTKGEKKTARRREPNGPRRVGLEIAKADYT